MKIALLDFSPSELAIGLAIVAEAVKERFPDAEFKNAEEISLFHDVDYLLVSLYWWRDVYSLPRFLAAKKIDPRKQKPVIIIGGMAALNPRPLAGYFHHAIIGDGEESVPNLLSRLESGESLDGLGGLWHPSARVAAGCVEKLKPKSYQRDMLSGKEQTSTRIEIMRGCPMQCAFCELAHIKRQRELPFEVVRQLIIDAPTKRLNIVTPDFWSHSHAKEIIDAIKSQGKMNTGSDIRLDLIKQVKEIARVRFGVEGFSEKTRQKIGKIKTNARLVDLLSYVFKELQSPKGKPIRTASMYLIGDFPGEGPDAQDEMWTTLAEFDRVLTEKFTLFFSVSSFQPAPFTPMEREGLNPYTRLGTPRNLKRTQPRYERLVIANRGGVVSAPQRLAQMITVRGDERCARVVFWLATQGYKFLRSTNNADGKVIEELLKKVSFDPEDLSREYDKSERLPWHNIEYPVPHRFMWDRA